MGGGRRSPRTDGLETEAALLSSAEASDASSEEGKIEPVVVTTIEEDEVEADDCGYEGDVGENTKLARALHRPSNLGMIVPQGIVTKVGAPTFCESRVPRYCSSSLHCTEVHHCTEHIGENVLPVPKGGPSRLVSRHTFSTSAPQDNFPT